MKAEIETENNRNYEIFDDEISNIFSFIFFGFFINKIKQRERENQKNLKIRKNIRRV